MIRLWLAISLIALSAASACAQSIARPLAKGDIEKGPHGDISCFLIYDPSQQWNTLQIDFGGDHRETIWKSVRSVGVSWSHNQEYLAVEDYLDRIATAVLVFKIDQEKKKADLIYQTPYSNSVFVQYHVLEWLGGGSALRIGRLDPKTQDAGSKEVVQLMDRKPITQTIYVR